MGIGALSLIATKIPLAIEIARRPVSGMDPALHRAVVLGLAMVVVLGGVTGSLISLHQGAMVDERGVGLPFFGWNQAGGDLRVAHFFGMHAEQALPLLAGIALAWRLPARVALVTLMALAWAGITVFAHVQARDGIAFPFG